MSLDEHAFFKAAHDAVRPLLTEDAIGRVFQESSKSRSATLRDLSSEQQYDLRVFFGLVAILRARERIALSRTLVRTFPISPARRGKGVHREEWIDYHFSYFVVTLASFLDLALALVNTVTRLGLPSRYCRFDLIVNHDRIRGTRIRSLLRGLDRILQGTKRERNQHVHQGVIPDLAVNTSLQDLDRIRVLGFAQRFEPTVSDAILTRRYKMELRLADAELEKQADRVFTVLSQLFDELEPMYAKQTP